MKAPMVTKLNRRKFLATSAALPLAGINPTNAAKLKEEVSEYVVTEKLQESFEKILDALYTGMESGSNEVGIWVSGFYGSGKSSFAKYLGYGLQKDFKIQKK